VFKLVLVQQKSLFKHGVFFHSYFITSDKNVTHIFKESVLYNHETVLIFSSVPLSNCWCNKVKVKLFICLINYHAVMRYGGVTLCINLSTSWR